MMSKFLVIVGMFRIFFCFLVIQATRLRSFQYLLKIKPLTAQNYEKYPVKSLKNVCKRFFFIILLTFFLFLLGLRNENTIFVA